MVVLFHKGSVEELDAYILSADSEAKVKKLTSFWFLLQCQAYRCYGVQPIRSVLETAPLFWEEEEVKTSFLLVLSFNFQLCLLLFSLTLQLNSTYFFNGFNYRVLSLNLQSTLCVTDLCGDLVLFFCLFFSF